MPALPPLSPPSTFVYDLRLIFVFVGVVLCLYVTAITLWLLYNVFFRLTERRYRVFPLVMSQIGLTLAMDTLFGYLGKIVWETRSYPAAGNEWLIIPIVAGAAIYVIFDFIHYRQYGRNWLHLLTITSRRREQNAEIDA